MTAVAGETPGLAGEDLEATGAMPGGAGEREGGSTEPPPAPRAAVTEPAEQAGEPAEQAGEPAEQAGEAAEQLAAAVTAALRPDAAPLDYGPYRQGVGAAVQRLRGALLGLIRELEPRTAAIVPDSAIARARDLAADIRFVRPTPLG